MTLAAAAPAFSLLIGGGLRLGLLAFAAIWGALSTALYATMYGTILQGNSSSRSIPRWAVSHASGRACSHSFPLDSVHYLCMSTGRTRVLCLRRCCCRRANTVFAALAFGLSAAWLGIIANEVRILPLTAHVLLCKCK